MGYVRVVFAIHVVLLSVGCGSLELDADRTDPTLSDSSDSFAVMPALVAPRSLSAIVVSSSAIDLQFSDPNSSENGFSIERRLDASLGFSEIATIARDTLSYRDSGLSPSTLYDYRVRAYRDRKGSRTYSPYSDSASATTLPDPNTPTPTATPTATPTPTITPTVTPTPPLADTIAPSVPTGLMASVISSSQINLSWNVSSDNSGGSGLKSYKVYRGGVFLKEVVVPVVFTADIGLLAETMYSYQVSALDNANNESAKSGVVSATTLAVLPTAPTNLMAQTRSTSQIDLSWIDTSSNEQGFKLERAQGSGAFGQIALLSAGVTSFSDSGLLSGTFYRYQVRATNSAGDSAYSNEASATTQTAPVPPNAPGNLRVTSLLFNRVDLAWDDQSANESGFKIERCSGASCTNFTQISTTGAGVAAFSDPSVSASNTYVYQVRAYNTAGNSLYSNTLSVTTPAPADTQAPSVSMTAPAPSSVIQGIVTLSATASDNVSVTRVDFFRDSLLLLGSDSVAPYNLSFDSTTISDGAHAIFARAYDAAFNVGGSLTVSVTVDNLAPSVPADLSASAASCSQINLSWSASTDLASSVSGYKIYKNGVFLKQVASVTTSDSGLSASTSYSYRVSAIDSLNHESAQSSVSSASTPACNDTTAPSVPAGLTATAMSCSQINLSWSASTDPGPGGSGLAGYKILRNSSQIATSATTSFNNTGLAASTSYSYTVAAYDNAGNTSTQSLAANANTPACSNPGSTTWGKNTSDYVTSLDMDPDGNSYVTGNFSGTTNVGGADLISAGNADVYVAKHGPSGNHLASYRFGGTNGETPNAIAVNPTSRDVVIVGSFRQVDGGYSDFGNGQQVSGGRVGTQGAFIAVYNSSGSLRWVRTIATLPTDYNDNIANDVAIDGLGNIVVTGYIYGQRDFGDGILRGDTGASAFLAKYSSSGAYVWARTWSSGSYANSQSIDLDLAGNPVISGYFTGVINFGGSSLSSTPKSGSVVLTNDLFLAKFGSAGNHTWSTKFGTNGDDNGANLDVSPSGEIAMTGSFGYQATNGIDFGGGPLLVPSGGIDVFVARFSPNGPSDPQFHVWSRGFGPNHFAAGNAVIMDGAGDVIIGGSFQYTIDLGGGPMTSTLISLSTGLSSYDAFVAKYRASDGTYMWAKKYGANASDGVSALGTDSIRNLYVGGGFNGTNVDFGGVPLTSQGTDGFLLKVAP